jgi:hypothetical protein
MTTLVGSIASTETFDSTHDAIVRGDIHGGMARLRASLRDMRSLLPLNGNLHGLAPRVPDA